jgi:hypothetical protein
MRWRSRANDDPWPPEDSQPEIVELGEDGHPDTGSSPTERSMAEISYEGGGRDPAGLAGFWDALRHA